MTTQQVTTTDGIDLAVEVRGVADAPTVVLVHGFPDSSRVWDEVAERLASTFHVVTYDVRGAGRSTAPPRRSGYRLERLADDLVAVADAVSPDAPVHVVGHDWGAIQAFEAATSPAHAARLASFTCVSGASFDHAGRALRRAWRDGVWSGLRRTVGQMATSWYILWFQLPVVPEAILRSPLGPRLVDRLEPVPPRPGHPAATFPRDAANGVNLYRANLGRVGRPRRDVVHVPVQVLVGADDPFVSVGLFDELGDLAEDAWLRVVGGGHWLPRTHPDTVADAVRALVDHVEGGAEPPDLRGARLR